MGDWVGMGVGVCGVCGPKVAPLAPFPVRQVEQTLFPPRVHAGGAGCGVPPPPGSKFCQGSPHMGDGVRGLRFKFRQGFPPRG